MYDYDGSSERKQAPRNPHAARQARDLCARIDSVGLYQLWLYQDGQMNQTIHRQSQSAESPTGKRSYSWSAFGTVTQSLVHLSKIHEPLHSLLPTSCKIIRHEARTETPKLTRRVICSTTPQHPKARISGRLSTWEFRRSFTNHFNLLKYDTYFHAVGPQILHACSWLLIHDYGSRTRRGLESLSYSTAAQLCLYILLNPGFIYLAT